MEAIRHLTGGIGVDSAIDAVGVDAYHAHAGPAAQQAQQQEKQFRQQVRQVAPKQNPHDGNWIPGDAPSQASQWAIQALAKAGTLSVIGVYPPSDQTFPFGMAMNKNLTIRMGNCNHRKYIPKLVDLVQSDEIDPSTVLTEYEALSSAVDAYKAFDQRRPGWIKVELAARQLIHPRGGGRYRPPPRGCAGRRIPPRYTASTVARWPTRCAARYAHAPSGSPNYVRDVPCALHDCSPDPVYDDTARHIFPANCYRTS